MCQAIREWSAEERAIGRGIGLAEGIEQGIEQGLERMIVDNLEERKPEEIIIKKLMRHFSLGEQQAKNSDETNKKVILENEQEVDFSLTDKIAIYIPSGHKGGYVKNKGLIFSANRNYNSSGYTVLEDLSSSKQAGDQVPLEVLLTYDDADMTLRATLNLVE